jgi:hypothetical protein
MLGHRIAPGRNRILCAGGENWLIVDPAEETLRSSSSESK